MSEDNFVFSSRNPIAHTLPLLFGIYLAEPEDFGTPELEHFYDYVTRNYVQHVQEMVIAMEMLGESN